MLNWQMADHVRGNLNSGCLYANVESTWAYQSPTIPAHTLILNCCQCLYNGLHQGDPPLLTGDDCEYWWCHNYPGIFERIWQSMMSCVKESLNGYDSPWWAVSKHATNPMKDILSSLLQMYSFSYNSQIMFSHTCWYGHFFFFWYAELMPKVCLIFRLHLAQY
jgi:hypothetical protein